MKKKTKSLAQWITSTIAYNMNYGQNNMQNEKATATTMAMKEMNEKNNNTVKSL